MQNKHIKQHSHKKTLVNDKPTIFTYSYDMSLLQACSINAYRFIIDV